MIEVLHYRQANGQVPFQGWMSALKHFDARARINARLDRLMLGNFGDCKPVGASVFELRLHFGPGYRVYFGVEKQSLVILLMGGDKRSQERDISKAQEYWRDYLKRRGL